MAVFKRKLYGKLLEWKTKYAGRYAILVEGARRVGKSTLVEEFAKNEYKSYILIDFSEASKNIKDCFDDIADLDRFFLRLQTITGVQLINRDSVIIFDEVQLYPRARQAIKYMVADGRYDYIETGSLISIKKNVKDILIPSEEMKLKLYPLDYEEFLWATGNETYRLLKDFYDKKTAIGNSVNRKLMRDFRMYMAVGGMPQAVQAYLEKKSFREIDEVKRNIIRLYEDDFRKIDASGLSSRIYKDVPSQLSQNKKRYVISSATGKKTQKRDLERLYDVIDSQTVLVSYNITKPDISLSSTKDLDSYKLYIADTGLFVTLMFIDRPVAENILYEKLLSDKLPANLGYLYENVAAQMIAASGRELCYHTWLKDGSTHYYEMDFLIGQKQKVVPIEIKSSATTSHKSIDVFCEKYSKITSRPYIFSQKDISNDGQTLFMPIYMLPFLLEE
ncbi:ATP-binding protein [Butyrivibrio sp. MC2013]|uniref:ATP-binding protein n=1 Tax=Butyrivibrio sp. MC2013 TaxID=1280686 RepID=UPI000429B458|nr:AAA family ATPase [Butyrivibrio sp. MC2013]